MRLVPLSALLPLSRSWCSEVTLVLYWFILVQTCLFLINPAQSLDVVTGCTLDI